MTLKLAKNLRFWGIDINVFMEDLSTLSLSLVLVAVLFRHLEGPKKMHIHVQHYWQLLRILLCFFACKRTMSEMKSCISGILKLCCQMVSFALDISMFCNSPVRGSRNGLPVPFRLDLGELLTEYNQPGISLLEYMNFSDYTYSIPDTNMHCMVHKTSS